MSNQTKICRICMLATIKGVVSLFTVYDGTLQICNKVMELANIQISCEDGLPMWICYNCLVHLETSYQFKMQAEKSDKLLRKQLGITIEDDSKHMVTDNRGNQGLDNIEGHVLLPVAAEDKSDPLINNVEQNGIKITNVMSQVDSEIVNLDRESDDTINRSEIGVEEVDISSITSVCTCVKGEDGIIITKCNNCIKIASDHITSAEHKYEECHLFSLNEPTPGLIKVEDVNEISVNNSITAEQGVIAIYNPLNIAQGVIAVSNPLTTTQVVAINNSLIATQGGFSVSDSKSEDIPKEDCDDGIFLGKKIYPPRNRYKCPICKAGFRCISHLKMHTEQVHGDGTAPKSRGMYKCPLCDEGFQYKVYLKIHLSSHNGVRPYKCDLCEKSFLYEEHLEKHRSLHKMEPKFKCDICDKKFKAKHSLYLHQKNHTDEQACICEHCGKVYNTYSGLSSHQKIHHPKDILESLQCEQCGKSFSHISHLRKHVRRHEVEPATCDICNKSYQNPACLRVHKYTVHAVKNKHQCSICKKLFKQKCTLRVHNQLKHSNRERPKCVICNMKFSQKTALQTHMKIIHTGLRPHSCKHCKMEFKWKQTHAKHEKKCLKTKIKSDSEEDIDDPK